MQQPFAQFNEIAAGLDHSSVQQLRDKSSQPQTMSSPPFWSVKIPDIDKGATSDFADGDSATDKFQLFDQVSTHSQVAEAIGALSSGPPAELIEQIILDESDIAESGCQLDPPAATSARQSVQVTRVLKKTCPIGDHVATSIFKRFRECDSAIILFGDTEDGQRGQFASLAIAVQLAAICGQSVLYIDSSFDGASLTTFLGLHERLGLRQFEQMSDDWKSSILCTDVERVSLLGRGKIAGGTVFTPSFSARLQPILRQMRAEFRFICVSSGTVFDSSLTCWSGLCDASYLTLDPSFASRSLARAARDVLNSTGARLAGCFMVAGLMPHVKNT